MDLDIPGFAYPRREETIESMVQSFEQKIVYQFDPPR